MNTKIDIDPEIASIGPTPEGYNLHAVLLAFDGLNVYLQERSEKNSTGTYMSKIMEFDNEDDAFYARRVWANFINDKVAEYDQDDIDYLEAENLRLQTQVENLSMVIRRVRSRTGRTHEILRECDHLLSADSHLKEAARKFLDSRED